MHRMSYRIALAVCAGGALLASGAALAMHTKAGLWQMTITVGGDDAARMPNMSNLPPDAIAAMKAHGVTMGGDSISVQKCMTGEEFAAGKPPPAGTHDKNCTMTNVSYTGSHMVADMSCTGTYIATGHVQFDWDSDEHFKGEVMTTGTQGGHTVTHDAKIEGRYLSASC